MNTYGIVYDAEEVWVYKETASYAVTMLEGTRAKVIATYPLTIEGLKAAKAKAELTSGRLPL